MTLQHVSMSIPTPSFFLSFPPSMVNTEKMRVTVHDEVLPAALCQELAVEIKDSAGADPDAHELSLMHPVPSSVYQKLLSIVDGDQQVVPLASMEAMLVPARVSDQGVPLHQVGSSCWLASLSPFRLTPPRASLIPLSTLAVAGQMGSFGSLSCSTSGRRLLWRQARHAS